MTVRMLFASLIVAVTPAVVSAQGCHHDTPDQTASSCVDGMVWDAAKGTCVAQPTS